jgi:probable phosphoglycerate mutase
LGKRQAEAIGKRFAVHGLNKIFTSSSTRAIQTAEPTCEMLKKTYTVLDWCNEGHAWKELTVFKKEENRMTWSFHYKPIKEIFARADVRALGKNFYEHPLIKNNEACANTDFKGGLERIQREADAFFLSLGYRHDYERGGYIAEEPNQDRVAMFAHQGVGLAFLSCVLDIPYNDICTRFDMGLTGMTVIEFSAGKGELCIPRVMQLSNDSHLYKEGLGTRYQNGIYI